MREQEEWGTIGLGENIVLVLGWRRNRRLSAGRLKLAAKMGEQLRSRATTSLEEVTSRNRRTYEETAHLEEDEVFLLELGDLPRRAVTSESPSQQDDESASQHVQVSALSTLLADPGELNPLDADDARDRSFLFYAVVFTDSDGSRPVAFVKRHNSAQILKTGFLLGQWGQTVTSVEDPVLVFAQDFDLVIDGEEIAALRPDAIQRLFADVEIAAAAVPALVRQLSSHKSLRLSSTGQKALKIACGRRRLLARRLQVLLNQPHLAKLTPSQVRKYLDNTGQDSTRFIKGKELVVAEADVEDLLDVLNQAHYLGGYDQLLRRADRSSIVKKPGT